VQQVNSSIKLIRPARVIVLADRLKFEMLNLIGVWVFSSSHEAKVYTQLTGKPVTTYQAMFVKLLVIEPAKPD
jgi:hypothetical protein